MTAVIFSTRLEGAKLSRWCAVKSHVLGQMGIASSGIGTAENFIKLANDLYEIGVPINTPFGDAVDLMHQRICALSKTKRRKLRKKNVDILGYETKPVAGIIRAAALRAARARKNRAPGAAKAAAIQAYRDRHLVLVTDDGKNVFNNVRQHASKEQREEFYKSWDWRTLRMKTIKRHGRRCQCCGATPTDNDSAGNPVRIVVDHIKPLSKYWQLRLVPSNLQILCDECNQGKGAWDETDHRPEEASA